MHIRRFLLHSSSCYMWGRICPPCHLGCNSDAALCRVNHFLLSQYFGWCNLCQYLNDDIYESSIVPLSIDRCRWIQIMKYFLPCTYVFSTLNAERLLKTIAVKFVYLNLARRKTASSQLSNEMNTVPSSQIMLKYVIVSFAQWRYSNQWSNREVLLLLVENYTQYPALLVWNITNWGNF